ncbi:MAG: hypothetical protein QXG86_01380 [Candidatus Woesearchaeota archaeon]
MKKIKNNSTRVSIFLFLLFFSFLFVSCSEKKQSNNLTSKNEEKVYEKESTTQEDAKLSLSSIIKNKIREFKVTYVVSSDYEKSEMTMYYKGQNHRIDFQKSAEADGENFKTSLFNINGKLYSCIETPKVMCYTIESSEKETSTFSASREIEENIERYEISKLPSRTIAGVTTACYKIKAGEETIEQCYSKEGIVLYIKASNYEMTAKNYALSVADSVFVLPAEPQKFGATPYTYN